MEENTYLVRIGSRFDTEADWMASDPVLLEGELAIVYAKSDIQNTLPEVRVKSGDGIHKFSELRYISANAQDVYAWAKQKYKPSYSADEIIGLEDYKHTHTIEEVLGLQEELDKKSESSNSDGSSSGSVSLGGQIIASADGGLKVTQNDKDVIISINDTVTFFLDGGDSSQFQS